MLRACRSGLRLLLTASRRPPIWTRSGDPASVSVSLFSVLYAVFGAVSGATKQAWALAPQALELSVLRVGLFGCVLDLLHNLLCGPLADSYPAGRAKMIIRNRYPFVKAIWPPIQGQFRRFLDPQALRKVRSRRSIIIRKGRGDVKEIAGLHRPITT